MKNILWLPSWYPSLESPQNGDFILRHALAVSKFIKISLLYIQTTRQKGVSVQDAQKNGNFFERTVFFHSKNRLNFLYYFLLYWKHYKEIYRNNEKPDLVHVHVCYRAGLFALWLKWRLGIPYIITEHWTLFTNERKDNYSNCPFVLRWLIRLIFKNAAGVLPVSKSLAAQIKHYFPKSQLKVVSNVVNPDLFYFTNNDLSGADNKGFHFIHVSSCAPIKNVPSILNVFLRLKQRYNNITLSIIGADPHELEGVTGMDLEKNGIRILGKLAHPDVAIEMRASHAFVLFSDYETQSCVSLEALCCGVPVVSSKLPCIQEFISVENGILVPPRDEDALYFAMQDVYVDYKRFDRAKIALEAKETSFPDAVGKQILDSYHDVYNKN